MQSSALAAAAAGDVSPAITLIDWILVETDEPVGRASCGESDDKCRAL